MGSKLEVDTNSIQYNSSLYNSNEYCNICSTEHICIDFIVDLEKIPNLDDNENNKIFTKYMDYLINKADTQIFLTDKPFRPIAHENVLYPRAGKYADFNWIIQYKSSIIKNE